jgi:hypothetical protein
VLQGVELHVPGQIAPLAEIAAIADFHDTQGSDRPYRRARPPDQVWRMIRARAGTRFNRAVVEEFLAALPLYPVGTRVRVTGGRWRGYTGVVARANREHRERPVIRVLAHAGGERVEPFELDLSREDATVAGMNPSGTAGPVEEAFAPVRA